MMMRKGHIKMSQHEQPLTSAELGKLWTTYMGNTMFMQVLQYMHKYCEDRNVRRILEFALNLSSNYVKKIYQIFMAEAFPIPKGFDESDVNMDAPQLFSEQFYLYYLRYLTKAALNVYSIAVPLTTRKDIRLFYTRMLEDTIQLTNKVNEYMISNNLYIKPPVIPQEQMPDMITEQNYLNGYFGKQRPLQALEITHLYDNIENNATSKAVLLGFSQVAKLKKVKNYFLKGKELARKHYDQLSDLLHSEDLPGPTMLDDYVLASKEAPFSDKLMLFHKLDMYTMRVRSYGNALSFAARHDIAVKIIKMSAEVGNYLEDGVNILIAEGWMEGPPQTINRKEFALT